MLTYLQLISLNILFSVGVINEGCYDQCLQSMVSKAKGKEKSISFWYYFNFLVKKAQKNKKSNEIIQRTSEGKFKKDVMEQHDKIMKVINQKKESIKKGAINVALDDLGSVVGDNPRGLEEVKEGFFVVTDDFSKERLRIAIKASGKQEASEILKNIMYNAERNKQWKQELVPFCFEIQEPLVRGCGIGSNLQAHEKDVLNTQPMEIKVFLDGKRFLCGMK